MEDKKSFTLGINNTMTTPGKIEVQVSDADLDNVQIGGEEASLENLASLYADPRREMEQKIMAEYRAKYGHLQQEAVFMNYTGPIPQNVKVNLSEEEKKLIERCLQESKATPFLKSSLSSTQNYPGAKTPIPEYIATIPPSYSTPVQMSPQELTTCVSNAIATGLEKAITGVLKSPELSSFIEGLTRSKGILGVMQGLATHSGRNALDARTMDQNALEIFHLMDKAIEATKARLQEKASGVELDPELKDAEKEFQEYLARLENDKGIS